MTCEQIRDRLDEYVDGDLTEAEFQEVELHLGGCPSAAQESGKSGPSSPGPPPCSEEMWPAQDLWPDIADRLRGPEGMRLVPRTGLARWMGPMSIAAAAAVVIALSAALWTRGTMPGVAPAPAGIGPARRDGRVRPARQRARLCARHRPTSWPPSRPRRRTLPGDARGAGREPEDDRRGPGPGAGGADRRIPATASSRTCSPSTHQKKVDALKRVRPSQST
jgi:hypothetical protein